MNTPGYESLADVLSRAYDQAANGKGKLRHACDRAFTEQPMQTISELLGSHLGLQYQAIKKIQESNRLDRDAQIRELLGAINYIAGAIIYLEAETKTEVEIKRLPPTKFIVPETCASCRHINPLTGCGRDCNKGNGWRQYSCIIGTPYRETGGPADTIPSEAAA